MIHGCSYDTSVIIIERIMCFHNKIHKSSSSSLSSSSSIETDLDVLVRHAGCVGHNHKLALLLDHIHSPQHVLAM